MGIGRFTLENGPEMIAAQFDNVAIDTFDGELAVTDAGAVLAYIQSIVPTGTDDVSRQTANRGLSSTLERRIAGDGAFRIGTASGR